MHACLSFHVYPTSLSPTQCEWSTPPCAYLSFASSPHHYACSPTHVPCAHSDSYSLSAPPTLSLPIIPSMYSFLFFPAHPPTFSLKLHMSEKVTKESRCRFSYGKQWAPKVALLTAIVNQNRFIPNYTSLATEGAKGKRTIDLHNYRNQPSSI